MQKVTTRTSVVDYLQRAVANSYAMYLNYKKYHWNISGPLFRDVHLLFDDHAGHVLETVDELGERVRMLGVESIGSAEDVHKHATVEMASGGTNARKMIEQAASNHKLMISEFKLAIKAADANNDPGTADLFTKTIQIHEKQLWFLTQFLERNDGLVSPA
ncbi:MAG: DNA starvation/stationary phase protection protein [Nitrososphaerota archaeon]|nr:DNA starvation/stationary phase protection protein [Nitrososphaerota archaeon]